MSDSYLRLVKVDDDFKIGWPVIEPICDSCQCCRLQLRRETGLQPLVACHHLHSLHLLFTETKHLTAEVLHLLVINAIQFMET